MDRLAALVRLYALLDAVRSSGKQGGQNFEHLKNSSVPPSGVYFFFEQGEFRTSSGSGLRVVRVGTHAINATSNTSLWSRLKQHRGNDKNLGGNHRGSIFRLLVGDALLRQSESVHASWGLGSTASRDVRDNEQALESAVSRYLRTMQVVVIGFPEREERRLVESSCIAVLSNFGKSPLDQSSPAWLGNFSSRLRVRNSGLWNNRDVDAIFQERALEVMERAVRAADALPHVPSSAR